MASLYRCTRWPDQAQAEVAPARRKPRSLWLLSPKSAIPPRGASFGTTVPDEGRAGRLSRSST